MTALLRPLTTLSSRKMDAASRLMKPQRKVCPSPRVLLPGEQYGFWEVIAVSHRGKAQVRCRCGIEAVVNTHDLVKGKSTKCKQCGCRSEAYLHIPPLAALQLQQRYNALCGRVKANKRSSRAYATIENRFSSCQDFVLYMWKHFPKDDYTGWEIDRIDSAGHYEKGNVRLATREENAQTRRCNIMVSYTGKRISLRKFARDYVRGRGYDWCKLRVSEGMSPEAIIRLAAARAKTRLYYVFRGNAYTIAAFVRAFKNDHYAATTVAYQLSLALRNEAIRLSVLQKFTTLSTQDAVTVSVVTGG